MPSDTQLVLNDPAQRDGIRPDPASDDAIEAFYGPGGGSLAYGSEATDPFPIRPTSQQAVGQVLVAGSRKVGWTVRSSKGDLLRAFAFNINPQAITRSYTSRTQLFATRGAFYVDNFGQGPTTITVSQLVAGGQRQAGVERTTARYDVVVGFYENIYKYVVEKSYSNVPVVVRFHDNHWKPNSQEIVYFPSGGLTVQRSVDQNNLWSVSIQMVSLESGRNSDQTQATRPTFRPYTVKRGDTLRKIILRALNPHGKHHVSTAQYQAYLAKVIALNKSTDDISKARTAPIYNTSGQQVGAVQIKRLHVAPGERIYLPA